METTLPFTDPFAPEPEDVLPEPEPMTDADAHGVIRRLAALDDEERALTANYKALQKDLEARREWLMQQEGQRLREWTLRNLKGKRRSVRTLHGVASFRTVPGRVTVTNEAEALEWARQYHSTLIEERLNVKRLKPEQFEEFDQDTGSFRYVAPEGLEVIPAREVFAVKSGGAAESEGE